jgi:large subunit ribosomal protein L30
MKKYIVTQVKSSIGISPKQKLYLKSLGLKKIGSKIEVAVNPSSEGLVKKVLHLVKVEVALN